MKPYLIAIGLTALLSITWCSFEQNKYRVDNIVVSSISVPVDGYTKILYKFADNGGYAGTMAFHRADMSIEIHFGRHIYFRVPISSIKFLRLEMNETGITGLVMYHVDSGSYVDVNYLAVMTKNEWMDMQSKLKSCGMDLGEIMYIMESVYEK